MAKANNKIRIISLLRRLSDDIFFEVFIINYFIVYKYGLNIECNLTVLFDSVMDLKDMQSSK